MKSELPPVPEPLPAPVTDSHCHLDVARSYSGLEPEDALQRAAAVNLTRLVQVGCDLESSRWAIEAAHRWPEVVAAVALHPNDAAALGEELAGALAELQTMVATEVARPEQRLRAIGETGLDFFRTPEEDGRQRQRESFAAHIALAREHDLTLVVHDREAHEEILAVLDAEGGVPRLVMHCFSGDADFARRCLDRGAWLSFPGTVTFKPNEGLREAMRLTPTDRLLTETDAPFLTPMPHRGHPNASFLVPLTVRFMAEQRAADLAELCRALHDNAATAFGGSW